MKITLKKNKFKKHLEKVTRAIPSATALPSLYGLLIKANGSYLTLIASDGILSIKEEIKVEDWINVEIPGDVLIPGKLFKDVLSKQSDDVTIETNDSLAFINSKDFKTEINLLNDKDYPKINFEIVGKEINIESEKLRNAIKNVSFAAAENDKRIILNGVNLKSEAGKLTVTATNSFRLAQEIMDVNSNTEFNLTLLSRNLKEFLPSTVSGEIIIQVDNTKILTKFRSTTISSRLIDGVYPNIDKLIPNEFISTLIIDVNEIVNLIDNATVVSEVDKKIVKLTVNSNELILESRKKEMGSTVTKTTNFEYSGDQFSIPFNAQFLRDAVTKFEGKIKIMFVGEQKQFVVKSQSSDSVTQLILPHRSF